MSAERTSPLDAHPTAQPSEPRPGEPQPIGPAASMASDAVELRRNGALAALLGALSLGVAIAYLSRAVHSGSVVDWAMFALLAAVGLAWFVACVDARTPLLVADEHGVRVRLGRSWRGLPWAVVDHIEHTPRTRLHDGRLAIIPARTGLLLEDLDKWGIRRAALNRRFFGAPAAFPLGLATKVVGTPAADLAVALDDLASGRAAVLRLSEHEELTEEVTPDVTAEAGDETLAVDTANHAAAAPGRTPAVVSRALVVAGHARTATAHLIEVLAARFQRSVEEPLVASPTPEPARETRDAARSEVTIALGTTADVESEMVPLAPLGAREEIRTWSVEDQVTEVVDVVPVIGPVFADARRILGLSIDQVSERTRIRPHVIEAIEADDFSACGGDFYARGHLRTLSRILGVDVEPLLATYDEKYAHAPIDPRQVFEAELAGHAGGIRGMRGGPNWSVLVAAVMAVVLSWSVARLVTEAPGAHHPATVRLSSDGRSTKGVKGPAIPIAVTAVKGGARVTIVDGTGERVWAGDLAVGQRKAISVAAPIHVSASDGGAVTVNVQGQDRGALGPLGQPGTGTFIAP